jgi:DNA polymerase III subunit epsilon
MYAIIDVETTGTSAAFGKITDIAVFIFNGKEITESFTTLINPECFIPAHITRLTGISNDMVAEAPKFYEVAKKIVEITAGRTFVAHNAMFDYSFIKQEFKTLGYDYKRKLLCTVKLGRKLLPGHRSYSLGNICSELGIPIDNRHRAAGDALATVKFFKYLLSRNSTSEPNLFTSQNYSLSEEKIASLPGRPGVYYLYDEKATLIYIGKSNDIHQRILTHLGNSKTKKAIEMRDRIADVSWEETGSELVALLLESAEIKHHKPLYNRLQRRSASNFGLFLFEDEDGFLNLQIKRLQDDDIPLTTFHFQKEGLDFLHNLTEKNSLCKKLCHLEEGPGVCFGAQVHCCNGACTGNEDPDEYNLRVKNAIVTFQYRSPDFFIVDKGRSDDEKTVIKIEKGKYIGFGFVPCECSNITELHDYIKPYKDNRDIQTIIRGYLRRNSNLKIIKFSSQSFSE